MRRRITALAATSSLAAAALLITSCDSSHTNDGGEKTMTQQAISAEQALDAIGLPAPNAALSITEGIVVSDADEWSVRITFSADEVLVSAWLADAFDGAQGLTVPEDAANISQRFHSDEIVKDSRYITGSHPADPSATYTVLISPDGRDVIIAAARTSR